MSKHFGKFATEAQYTAGLSSLDFPNVSLVEQTGNIHYSVAVGPKQIWDAAFGDILFYDVDGDTLITFSDEEYNTTDYPVAKFEPIGVCIYDKASYEGNNAVFMSLKWMDCNNPNTGNYQKQGTRLGNPNVNFKTTLSTDFGSQQYVDTKNLNNKVKSISNDYTGTIYNNSDEGNFPAFMCCWRFAPNGTSAGDWYLPSYYDLYKYFQNYSYISTILTSINTKTNYNFYVNYEQWVLTESIDNTENYALRTYPRFSLYSKTQTNSTRAVYFAGPAEL